jgi:hypothetical protein
MAAAGILLLLLVVLLVRGAFALRAWYVAIALPWLMWRSPCIRECVIAHNRKREDDAAAIVRRIIASRGKSI